jgi:hypothetical protein
MEKPVFVANFLKARLKHLEVGEKARKTPTWIQIMATREPQTEARTEPDENLLEDHESLADTILEQGEAYRGIRQRRDLKKTYDELEPDEKWRHALEVLENRAGERYSSPRKLIQDIRAGEVLQDGLPWDTYSWEDYESDEHDEEMVVEEPFATEVDDGSINVRVQAYLDGREDEGFLYRLGNASDDWEEHKRN